MTDRSVSQTQPHDRKRRIAGPQSRLQTSRPLSKSPFLPLSTSISRTFPTPFPTHQLTPPQIDSAIVYANEAPCGAAIEKSNLPRTSIFFVSKVFPPLSYETSKSQLRKTLSDSGLSYLDLCLIHHPGSGREDRKGAWKALVEAQREGLVRSIGVSNYGLHHLQEMEGYQQELEEEGGKGAGGTIDVGQWELQPWLGRKEIVNWCRERNVVLQAYSPLLQGKRFDDPLLKPLVEKHKKTPAQILLRWSLQKGFVPLPKSVTPARIVENTLLYDFELDEGDMASLETGAYESCTWDPTLLPLERRYKSHLTF